MVRLPVLPIFICFKLVMLTNLLSHSPIILKGAGILPPFLHMLMEISLSTSQDQLPTLNSILVTQQVSLHHLLAWRIPKKDVHKKTLLMLQSTNQPIYKLMIVKKFTWSLNLVIKTTAKFFVVIRLYKTATLILFKEPARHANKGTYFQLMGKNASKRSKTVQFTQLLDHAQVVFQGTLWVWESVWSAILVLRSLMELVFKLTVILLH